MLCGREGRTPRRTLEVADIFRQYATRLGQLSRHCARTVRAIVSCRTARLGGHVRRCDQCGYRETSYNSCRNRHCPKCQGLDEVRWVEAQRASLLPIGYHHVVFTVPEALQVLFRAAPRATYNRLFQAVSQTLLEVGERPRNLGARIGFTAVLHTWTQTLLFHPHLHCVVTGGGLSRDGTLAGCRLERAFSSRFGSSLRSSAASCFTGSSPTSPPVASPLHVTRPTPSSVGLPPQGLGGL